jgi:hypothetical protein
MPHCLEDHRRHCPESTERKLPASETILSTPRVLAVKIEAVEAALLELAARLDRPFETRSEADDVAMALGHRARALYRGYLTCTESGVHKAASALLRPMIETNILLRFIRERPELRAQLWQAESVRLWIELFDETRRRPLPAEQKLEHMPTEEELTESRRYVAKVRKQAQDAGVKGVKRQGPLIPPVRAQAELLDTPEVWQAYVTAYTPLGFEQHVGHGSFGEAVQHPLEGGLVIHEELETPRLAVRLLASTAFASTLVIVSSWLRLGIEEAARQLQERLVRGSEAGI